jgi:ferredoxin
MNFTQESCGHTFAQERQIMADKTNRLPQNVQGAYYVDSSCVDCDLCRNTAPDFFKRDEETGFSFVYRQPVRPEEHALAEEARQGCPTESIGNEGITEVVVSNQT